MEWQSVYTRVQRAPAIQRQGLTTKCTMPYRHGARTGFPMPVFSKAILAANGLWFRLLIGLFVFPSVAPAISGFAILLSIPIAVVLFVLALIALIKEKRKRWAIVSICLTLAVSFIALRHVTYWGALTHLYLHKRKYEIQAQKMLVAQDEAER